MAAKPPRTHFFPRVKHRIGNCTQRLVSDAHAKFQPVRLNLVESVMDVLDSGASCNRFAEESP